METLGVIGDFYALCERAQSIEDVAKALFETAHRTGFPHASYLCGGSPANPDAGLLLTNYPAEWRQRYLQQRYHRIDPIISRAQRTIDPFMWSDPLVRAAMTPKQLRMMEEAKTFRVGHGYAVPLHSSMQVGAACFFASEHNDIPPVSCKTMQRVSVIAHEHVCRMARLSNGRGETPQLSARERACLSLHAQGLGDAEDRAHTPPPARHGAPPSRPGAPAPWCSDPSGSARFGVGEPPARPPTSLCRIPDREHCRLAASRPVDISRSVKFLLDKEPTHPIFPSGKDQS